MRSTLPPTRKSIGATSPESTIRECIRSKFVTHQLQRVGIEPETIDYMVLSPLHLDHAGGVGYFPRAQYVVQRPELHWAHVPDFYRKAAYLRADFDREVDWLILKGRGYDDYDLFGDGSIRIWFTPGHIPFALQNSVFRELSSRLLPVGEGLNVPNFEVR